MTRREAKQLLADYKDSIQAAATASRAYEDSINIPYCMEMPHVAPWNHDMSKNARRLAQAFSRRRDHLEKLIYQAMTT